MNFSSDNAFGAAPEMIAALERVRSGPAAAYGDDEETAALKTRMRELFECDLELFLVATGTAANSLALSSLSPSYGIIFCHEESHIHVDEAGAPEFFTQGAKLLPLPGFAGKLTVDAIEKVLWGFGRGGIHQPVPSVVSLTQATELGTLYQPEEIRELTGFAKSKDMSVHMDGARFANAIATLGCAPADITWRAGVDILCFGATKNGAMASEAVIFFDKDKVGDFGLRQKRAGQVFSKGRFPAAQFNAYLEDGLWQKLAKSANAKAQSLNKILEASNKVELAYPVEGNEIFIYLEPADMQTLFTRGAVFYPWPAPLKEGRQLCRLVTSFETQDEDIIAFEAALRGL